MRECGKGKILQAANRYKAIGASLGLVFTLGLAAAACGGSDTGPGGQGGEGSGEGAGEGGANDADNGDVADTTEPSSSIKREACSAPAVEVAANKENVKSDGATIHYTRFVPASCTKETPCPAIFLVPGGLMGGDDLFGLTMPKVLASATGSVVVWFNPPGRGQGAQLSEGSEDFNGRAAQDAFRSVFNLAKKRQDTTEHIGIISIGSGLSIAAGALSRHGTNTMAEAKWLIDVEGPLNRCGLTQTPLLGNTPFTNDGPGATGTKCDFQHAERETVFPVNASFPASVLCNVAHTYIAESGNDCSNDAWWREREPNQFISKLRVEYLRVQMKFDHAAATRWHSLIAVYYALQGSNIKYRQLNNVANNTPVLAVGDESCLEQGCYLDLAKGNAFVLPECSNFTCTEPVNPYHADHPDYRPMDFETFFTCALPNFVTRMQERQ